MMGVRVTLMVEKRGWWFVQRDFVRRQACCVVWSCQRTALLLQSVHAILHGNELQLDTVDFVGFAVDGVHLLNQVIKVARIMPAGPRRTVLDVQISAELVQGRDDTARLVAQGPDIHLQSLDLPTLRLEETSVRRHLGLQARNGAGPDVRARDLRLIGVIAGPALLV